MTAAGKPLLNVLVAYPYFKQMKLPVEEHKDSIRLLIDSGAFTAFKQGKPIEMDEYCSFLEKMPVRPWRYFMLDVIGQPEATMRNYEEMLRRGLEPIPVFTRGTDPQVLDVMFSTSDLVAIGGLVGTPKNRGFVNGIMERVAGRRVHLLGFANMSFLKTYRPYSCDAGSWNQQSMYGTLNLYMGHGESAVVSKERAASGKLSERIKARLHHYGIEPASLRLENGWSGAKDNRAALMASYRSQLDLARDIEMQLGTKYFFACPTGRDFELLMRAREEWR